jgi:type II secretory pathway component PulF
MLEGFEKKIQRMQFGAKQQKAFLEDLASLMKDGVPAAQAVDTIAKISSGIVQEVAGRLMHAFSEGHQLADGMQGWFARATVEIIRAGENSGTLDKTISSALESLSQQSSAVGGLINSMLYPLTVLIAALGMAVFVKNSVLINFTEIKPLAEWPSTGQNMYALAMFVQHWWWFVILVLVFGGLGLAKLLRYLTGDWRVMIDSLPVISLYRDSVAAQFMETVGMLIENGVTLKKALTIMHKDASPYLTWHLLMMEFRLGGGKENIADVIDTHLIKESDLVRLRVVARGKGFEHALISLGRQASQRNTKVVDLIGKILGGMVLAGGAGIAAMMVFGIYTVGSAVAT